MCRFIKYLSILFLIIYQSAASQNHREIIRTIDSLLHLADNYIYVDFEKTLIYAQKASILSEKSGDSQEKVKSYYYISRALISFRQFDKASVYLEKAFQEKAAKNNDLLNALLLSVEATYYSRMALEEQSFQNNVKALALLKSKKDLESQLLVSFLYIKIADYYYEMGDYQKAHSYADLSIVSIDKIPVKDYFSVKKIYRNKPFIYFYKSWFFFTARSTQISLPIYTKSLSTGSY